MKKKLMKKKLTKTLLSLCLICGPLFATPGWARMDCEGHHWNCEMDAYWDYLYGMDNCGYLYAARCQVGVVDAYNSMYSICQYDYISCSIINLLGK